MKIKEFEAPTLKDCLQRIRLDLGPEAVILETRKLKRGGVMGLGARDAVRILAATGIAPAEEATSRGAEERGSRGNAETLGRGDAVMRRTGSEAVGRWAGGANHPITRSPNRPITQSPDSYSRLERELKELRQGFEAIRRLVPEPLADGADSGPGPHSSLCDTLVSRLTAADVEASLAQELVDRLPDLSAWGDEARIPLADSALRDLMAGRVQCAGPIAVTAGEHKRVGLVGPTGVGKTTTVAKLAAHYALVEKRKVGLLTVDTYRIAAVEQLRTYSQIIDIPIKVAHSQAEIGAALDALSGCELVLIDTAGRSQKHIMHVSELCGVLNAADCEAHLVLTASTKLSDLRDQVERFGRAAVDCLLFTKLDETASYGTIYTLAAQAGIPLSYLTTGQKVPEDIEVADGAKLAALVLGAAP